LIGYGKYGPTEFIRLITINATNTEKEILHFFKVLEEGAKELENKNMLSMIAT
jgi:hypothetical protein